MPQQHDAKPSLLRTGLLPALFLSLGTVPTYSLTAAETMNYWRFETTPGFVEDSVGTIPLQAPNFEPLPLTNTGRGRYFPSKIAGIGSNQFAAESVAPMSSFRSDESTPITDALTIEMFANFDSLSPDLNWSILASQSVPGVGSSKFGWALLVDRTGDGAAAAGVRGDAQPRELAFYASDGRSTWCLSSGIILDVETDYYISGSIDVNSDARFYVKNLVTGTIQQSHVEHTLKQLNPSSRLWVHGADTWGTLEGVLDEVRLSHGVLPIDQLLVNLTFPLGDVNEDGLLSSDDIDHFSQAKRNGQTTPSMDLDHDGNVDRDDHRQLIKSILKTWYGDSNLDGLFNTEDLVAVFQEGQYQDTIPGNSGWSEGDWDGDGDFSSEDFVIAFQDGGFEAGALASVALAVPEPCLSLVVLTILGLMSFQRRKW